MIQRYLYLICSIGLLHWGTMAWGQGIVFEQMTWDAIKEKAKKEGKPIFVDVYASWCEPCKWMEDHTFSEQSVGSFFNEHYISCKMNIDKKEGGEFATEHRVLSYPTLLYFDENGQLVHRLLGSFMPKELIQKSKDALNPENQIYTLQRRFEGGERDAKFLYQYVFALSSIKEDYSAVADAYLKLKGDEGLLEEENFEFLERFINDYEHEAYRHVLMNKAKFVLAFGMKRIDNYLDTPFRIKCYELVEKDAGKAAIRAFHEDVKMTLPHRSDYFKARINFYYNRGDNRKDYRFAKKYEKHCKDSKSLNALVRYILDMYGSSKTHLESALEWSDKAILLDENIYTLESKAMVLLALDRRDEALTVAEKQLELSKEKEEHIEETEALIQKIKNS